MDTPKDGNDVATPEAKLGVATFEWGEKSITLEVGVKAMIRIYASFNQDISDWIAARWDGGRVGQAEVFHALQVDSNHNIEEILEMFFMDMEVTNSIEFQLELLRVLCEVTGKRYRDILNALPADLTPTKKKPE